MNLLVRAFPVRMIVQPYDIGIRIFPILTGDKFQTKRKSLKLTQHKRGRAKLGMETDSEARAPIL